MPPFGTNAPDILTGTAGNDVLYGYGDADIFYHSAGNDHFDGGSGAGTAGGSDYDTLLYLLSDHGVVVDARHAVGSTRHLGSEERDTFTGIEKIVGSVHDDVVHAGATTDIDGFAGNDWIYSGSGANRLNGGSGHDTLSYQGATSGVKVNLLTGQGEAGWAAGDLLSGFEDVYGSEHNDYIIGDNGANAIWGGGGNDFISANVGDDRLYGGNGHDSLWGGNGDDTLHGGNGRDVLMGHADDDVLIGGADTDYLYGGAGADRFVIENTQHSKGWDYGIIDIIYDFSRAEGDRIDVSAIDANGHLAGNQAFSGSLLHVTGSPGGLPQFTAGKIAYAHVDGDTHVYFNTMDPLNASAADLPEMQLILKGIHHLSASDFIL